MGGGEESVVMGIEYDAEGTMIDAGAMCYCLCGAVVIVANAAAVTTAAVIATTFQTHAFSLSIPPSHQG